MRENKPQPFTSLGKALKKLRENSSKSQAEVSGAVEIDLESIESYELGATRPSEDILLLIIQHFDLKDDQAKELWRLAGYEDDNFDGSEQYFSNDEFSDIKTIQPIAIPNQDGQIVYTDMIQVMINNYGVIINFMQGAGVKSKPLAVARVGMSKEHARSVVDVLTKTLDQADKMDKSKKQPKRLHSGKKQKDS